MLRLWPTQEIALARDSRTTVARVRLVREKIAGRSTFRHRPEAQYGPDKIAAEQTVASEWSRENRGPGKFLERGQTLVLRLLHI